MLSEKINELISTKTCDLSHANLPHLEKMPMKALISDSIGNYSILSETTTG